MKEYNCLSEDRENEIAFKAVAALLERKEDIQAWHVPDWITDQNEHTGEPDDLQLLSFFDKDLEKLQKLMSGGKSIDEKPLTKEDVLKPYQDATIEDLFDPDEYNPENHPWYNADDEDVDLK